MGGSFHKEKGKKKESKEKTVQTGTLCWHGGRGKAMVQWVDGHPGTHHCTVGSPNSFHTTQRSYQKKVDILSLFNDRPLKGTKLPKAPALAEGS